MRRDLCVLLYLFMVFWCTPARAGLLDLFGSGGAGMVVFDPANNLQLAVSAAEAVKQTALQIRAEVQRLQQLEAELQQLKSLPEDTIRGVLADWQGQLGILDTAGQTLTALGSQLAAVQQLDASRLRQIAMLGLSPQVWLQRELTLAGLHRQAADTLFSADRQALTAIGRSSRALQQLQAQIPASSGMQQSLQTTNQYLDLLAGQTSQLLQLTAAHSADEAGRRSVDEAAGAAAAAREMDRIQHDLDSIASLRSQLRSQDSSQGLGILAPLP